MTRAITRAVASVAVFAGAMLAAPAWGQLMEEPDRPGAIEPIRRGAGYRTDHPMSRSGTFAEHYPAAEVQAVPFARARTAEARVALRQAETALNNAVRDLRRNFENSPIYREAVTAENQAYNAYLNARQSALQPLIDEPRYLAMKEMSHQLGGRISDEHGRRHSNIEEILSLATLKLEYAAIARTMETALVNGDEGVHAARQDLRLAKARVLELREAFADSVREDSTILAAREDIRNARVDLVTAEAFLDSAIRARNIAMSYAYFIHSNHARYSRYSEFDRWDYDYRPRRVQWRY